METVQFLASKLNSDISQVDTSSQKKNKVGESKKIQCISLTYSVNINSTESGKNMSCYTSRTREVLIIKVTLFLSSMISLNWLSGDIPLPLSIKIWAAS